MKNFAMVFTVFALVAGGCGDDGGGGAEQGTLGNACYGNGTCNSGLSCNGGICVGTGEPGTVGNACYPNGTCNMGLECASGVCVDPTAPPPPPPEDGGTDADARPPGMDGAPPPPPPDGGTGTECAADMSDDVRRPYPDACLPRCSAATGATIAACEAALEMTMFTEEDFMAFFMCADTALRSDPTPEVVFEDSTTGEGVGLNCEFCYGGVYDICNDMFCLEQSRTARGCDFETDADMCEGEYRALEMCVETIGLPHSECVVEQQGRCFASM